jgi:hypothetical protein
VAEVEVAVAVEVVEVAEVAVEVAEVAVAVAGAVAVAVAAAAEEAVEGAVYRTFARSVRCCRSASRFPRLTRHFPSASAARCCGQRRLAAG